MDWRTLNERVLAESGPAPQPAPMTPVPQRVLAALASTRTSALRTAGAMSLLLGIPELEIVAALKVLEAAGVAVPEWNGMDYVWHLSRRGGTA